MPDSPAPSFGALISAEGVPELDDPGRFNRYLERLKGKRVRFEVRREYRSRSLSQNRRLWFIYKAIAEWSGHDTYEIHEALKAMFLPKRALGLPNESVIQAEPSTRILSIEEFGDYMTRCEVWAAEQGCELPNWEDFS